MQEKTRTGNYHIIIFKLNTETEGNSDFCGPETAVCCRGEAEGNHERSRGHKSECLPAVAVNKCLIILYSTCQRREKNTFLK